MTTQTAASQTLAVSPPGANERSIAVWLLGVAAMVLAMVVIGGVTRLTESGLSIAEWRPLGGILPPLSNAAWERLFALYQQSPEFRQINAGMSLAGFKTIFWWEFIHRLWGRLIGLAFFLPFAWFLLRGAIPRRLAPRLALLFVLGGGQGLLGWYMVQSGLRDVPWVSPYRLTAHLALALAIYAALVWTALQLRYPVPETIADRRLSGVRRLVKAALAMISLTIVWGGFVAGTDAGFTFNTFPLMDGRLVPAGYLPPPWHRSAFEDLASVQFTHRVLAIATLAVVLTAWWRTRWVVLSRRGRRVANALAGFVCLQVALGISTLLLVVPVPLAAAHQAGAVILLSCALWLLYELRPPHPA